MQIRSVTAHAFGPLAGETLRLAEGMTVIVGDNESAKSSWHAAILAALCGRRRGKGAPRREEQRFIDLHKPWDREEWLVTAEVMLDDGRRIELRHDLAAKVACHAKDLDLGNDISAEVMNDGAPDGARWVGLDRTSFAATACIAQADVLGVLGAADGLQETLQRAAATAGTDATAAAALECLDSFKREHVGTDRANSTKPLRRATIALQNTERALDDAKASHALYLQRVEHTEALHRHAHDAQQRVAAYEAAAATHTAEQLCERLREAEELDARFGGLAPPDAADDDEIANAVANALASWRSVPVPGASGQRSSAEIEQELAALPIDPEGDTVVHENVRLAEDQLARAEAQLSQHDRSRPAATPPAPQVAAGDDELLDLARVLDSPIPEVPAELVQRERAAQRAASAPTGTSPQAATVGSVAGIVVGLAALALRQPVSGAVLVVVGLVLAAYAVVRRRASEVNEAVVGALATAQAAVLSARQQLAAAEQRRAWAIQRCGDLGLPADAAAVRAIPVARAAEKSHAESLQRWTEQRAALADDFSQAAGGLAGALAARGHTDRVADLAGLRAATEAYRADCATRAAQAAAAARRADLVRQLEAALEAERRVASDVQARGAAANQLVRVARERGIPVDTPEQAETELMEWQQRRAERISRLSDEQKDWTQLNALLNGGSLNDLRSITSTASEKAGALAARVSPEVLATVDGATADEQLPRLREEAAQTSNLAATAEGELRQFAGAVLSVSEAEESLEGARAELARVCELEETLELTAGFLKSAQERVHRDIAPLLANTVCAWLPKITNDRYVDVVVNPTSLEVQVAGVGGTWRRADLLSYGTAEQIYLLLRIALVDHLTRGHDTCPLLLDDVTVHADASRTVDILNLLHEVSKERQIVLFTQEANVATWAQRQLSGPRDAVVQLTEVSST
ncbi:MAG TPA: AAA family ATPase [Mycobacteriales bacterium]|nr:AAA family ATPase [Mycobacteriales bacterium]